MKLCDYCSKNIFLVTTSTLILAMCVCGAMAETIYRLPIRVAFIDTILIPKISTALDSALSRNYTLVVLNAKEPFSPDSSVCSAQITDVDSLTVTLSFDLYSSEQKKIVSYAVAIDPEVCEHDALTLQILKAIKTHSETHLVYTRLQISGTKGASVFIDKEFFGKIPVERFMQPGSYSIDVTGKRFVHFTYPINLVTGCDTTLYVDLWQKTYIQRITLWSSSVLFTMLSIYLNKYQHDIYGDYQSSTSDFNRFYRNYQIAVVGRDVSIALAGVSAFFSLFLFFDIPF